MERTSELLPCTDRGSAILDGRGTLASFSSGLGMSLGEYEERHQSKNATALIKVDERKRDVSSKQSWQ